MATPGRPARCSIITRNTSPDLGFDRSINPFQGCEHGCIYCYARPTHAWLNLSPGLDFETRLFYKLDAAKLLEAEMERLLEAAAAAGVGAAGNVFLRLPLEVAPLFEEWLQARYPLKAAHVTSLVRQSRSGRDYDTRFGKRMRGEGLYAELLAQRFRLVCKRLGLGGRRRSLRLDLFAPPVRSGDQLSLL